MNLWARLRRRPPAPAPVGSTENGRSLVALRMYRRNGEQIHALYDRGGIAEAWLCGPDFNDIRGQVFWSYHPPGYVVATGPLPPFVIAHEEG